jgi:hypothetical protein
MPSTTGFGSTAGGDINPRRFVKIGATAGVVLEADAGDQIEGISQPGTRRATTPDVTHTLAAKIGEGIRIFRDGEVTEIEAGAAFTIGARLKSDGDGKGIAVAANNDQYGAVALAAATAAGQFVPVRVEIGVHGQ